MPNPEPLEELDLAHSEIWRICGLGLLEFVSSKKLLDCEGGVTRSVFMVQCPIVFPFFWPAVLNGFAQML
jgi:hypothetical protein